MLNYSAIPVIVVICYVIITAIKTTKVNSKWYPIISCAIGAALAAVLFFIFPEFIGATTLTAAIISGAVSGLAATGTNQIFKQLLKAAANGEDLNTVIKGKGAGAVATVENGNAQKNNDISNGVKRTNDTGGDTPENGIN